MNELKHKTEFERLLANYKLSSDSRKILADASLVLLVGPTSSGRNTIIEELVKTGEYYHIVSDTTREMRFKNGKPLEKNGREYWFTSEAEMLKGIKRGEYMEAAVIHDQQVSGCSIREVAAANSAGKVAIKDITETGAETVHGLKPDTVIVFVTVPDYATWMSRLKSRSKIPAEELRRRMVSAAREYRAALSHDYYQVVVNENLASVVKDIDMIAKQHGQPAARQHQARAVAQAVYQEIINHLEDVSAFIQ